MCLKTFFWHVSEDLFFGMCLKTWFFGMCLKIYFLACLKTLFFGMCLKTCFLACVWRLVFWHVSEDLFFGMCLKTWFLACVWRRFFGMSHTWDWNYWWVIFKEEHLVLYCIFFSSSVVLYLNPFHSSHKPFFPFHRGSLVIEHQVYLQWYWQFLPHSFCMNICKTQSSIPIQPPTTL